MLRIGLVASGLLAIAGFARVQGSGAIRVEAGPRGERVVIDPSRTPDGITLDALVREMSEIVGVTFQWKSTEEAAFRTTRLGLSGPLACARDRAGDLLERLLFAYGFVCIVPPDGAPGPTQIVSLAGQDRNTLKTTARLVPFDELERWRGRPVLIQTTWRPRYVDPGRTAAFLRSLFSDPNLESVGVVGDSLVFIGFASNLVALVPMLRELDVESRAPEARAEPAAPAVRPVDPARDAIGGFVRRVDEAFQSLRIALRDLETEIWK